MWAVFWIVVLSVASFLIGRAIGRDGVDMAAHESYEQGYRRGYLDACNTLGTLSGRPSSD